MERIKRQATRESRDVMGNQMNWIAGFVFAFPRKDFNFLSSFSVPLCLRGGFSRSFHVN